MGFQVRFAVISDPHVALPHTILDFPNRFHLVEISVPSLEQILDRLARQDLDFVLMPGDLTQHGERDNHLWLAERLKQLPFPVYVVPGNHDLVQQPSTCDRIGLAEFPYLYQDLGYRDPRQPYYRHDLAPGLVLIGLNSIGFDSNGDQLWAGWLTESQLAWLEETLQTCTDSTVMVMVHHNVLEHLPKQAQNPLGKRYMVENRHALLEILQRYGVRLLLTGHLHVQDVAEWQGLCEITTGSLVSYPHPYRLMDLTTDDRGRIHLQITSHQVEAVEGWPTLLETSRQWMCDRSRPFMMKLLMQPPLDLSLPDAEAILPYLNTFWSEITAGDALFDFSHLPPKPQHFFEQFSALDENGQPRLIDNQATLIL